MLPIILAIFFSGIINSIQLPPLQHDFFISQWSGGERLAGLPAAQNKTVPQKINEQSLGVAVTAKSGILVDLNTGRILWEKNSSEKRSIASITKVMSALVFLDNNPGWNKEITILGSDQREGASSLIYTGETFNVKDLFYLTLVRSVNSGVVALVRSTGLSEENFVKKMNEKAKMLGMKDTVFTDPTGLDPKNISTAVDLSLLLKEALTKEPITSATTLQNYQAKIVGADKERNFSNTDALLTSFLNKSPYKILGGKTGYLTEAGYCLSLGVENSGHKIISIILGSDSINNRFVDTKGIVDWAFSNYKW